MHYYRRKAAHFKGDAKRRHKEYRYGSIVGLVGPAANLAVGMMQTVTETPATGI